MYNPPYNINNTCNNNISTVVYCLMIDLLHGSNTVQVCVSVMSVPIIYHSSHELCLIPCLARIPPLELRILLQDLAECLRWHDIHCTKCTFRFKWDLMRYPLIPPWCLECCENAEDDVDLEDWLIKRNELTSYYLENGVRMWIIDTD